MNRKTIIAAVVGLLMIGCGGNHTGKMQKLLNTLPDVLEVGHNLLERDSIEQDTFPYLGHEQCVALAGQIALDVPDSTQLIGARPAGEGIFLEAYKVPVGEGPNLFKVYLVTRTRDNEGVHVDALDLREFHTCEYQGQPRFGGNRYYTLDTRISFDGKTGFTVHRLMTLTSLFLKDHRLTEMWRVEWDNNYTIGDDGRIRFEEQCENYRTAGVDDPMIEEYQTRDLPK